MDKKYKTFSILIIIIIISSIWFVKNSSEAESNQQASFQMSENISEKSDANMDFNLIATSTIDFQKLCNIYKLPLIVDYGSESCKSCKMMAPVLKTMNIKTKGKAIIKFVDVWKYRDAASNIPLQLIPSQVFFGSDGKPFNPSKELNERLEFILYNSPDSKEHAFTVHQGSLSEKDFMDILIEMGVKYD